MNHSGPEETNFLDANEYKGRVQDKPSRLSTGSRESGTSGRLGGGSMGRSQSTPRSQNRSDPGLSTSFDTQCNSHMTHLNGSSCVEHQSAFCCHGF